MKSTIQDCLGWSVYRKSPPPPLRKKISENLRFFLRGGGGGGAELYTGYILDYLTCDEIRILEPSG